MWFAEGTPKLYSLIASAQRHGLDPLAYLRHLLAHIMTTPTSELDQFLPDVYKARLAAEKAAENPTSPVVVSPTANNSPPTNTPPPATASASIPGSGP